ncbi:MAG: biopolymer transporter ExbD [Myxococcota bacterium]
MGAQLGAKKGPMAEINVTPLIDVVLVLLVVFMVITPMLSAGLPVDLPMATQTETLNEDQQIVISVTAKGEVAVDQEILDTELEEGETEDTRKARVRSALIEQINVQYQINPERTILVKADSTMEYGKVREVLDMLAENRFTAVFIAAGKEK